MQMRRSIVGKYLLISLVGAVVPMFAVATLYDRYASNLLEQITGERLAAQLSATASKLNAFLDVRTYQLETLSNYPALPGFALMGMDPGGEIGSILRIEADSPDLYGILFFTADGELSRVVAGQAASGPPYWSDQAFTIRDQPVTRVGDTEIVGPMPAALGQSGYILMRQSLRPLGEGQRPGNIALHVRLASITEQMGGASLAGIVQPVLKTPAGIFDSVGRLVTPKRQMAAGPEIMPGWQPMLIIDPDQLISPFVAARQGLYLAAALVMVVIVVLFARLSGKLRDRVQPLAQGAQALAAGDLDHRIQEVGDDEIGGLARSFNVMAARLRDNVERTLKVERLAALGEFATGVAHEIRNPLATIKTSVQALARGEPDDERRGLFSDMEAEIDRLARVMDDVLAFGRPRLPERVPVTSADLFRRVSGLMGRSAAEKRMALTVAPGAEVTVWVDRDQMMQVLVNLVLNSIQAGRDGGTIVLRARPWGEDGGEIVVEDDGSGIPADIVTRVTDPFFTTKSQGTGLGLAISRQLVELNGGSLAVDTELGWGTRVSLRFPMAEDDGR